MRHYLLLLFFISLFSCGDKQDQSKLDEDTKPLLSIVKDHSKPKEITTNFKKDIEGWDELIAVNDFLERFKKVSANEVLSNALELKSLAKNLRDSVKPKLFNTSAFNARVNILYNETLRLADMTNIPAIKAEDVHKQTEKIIESFSAVNAKVNTVMAKKRFEEEISIDISFIGLDSTKMDSVTKKSINKKFEPKLDQKVLPKEAKSGKGIKSKKQ